MTEQGGTFGMDNGYLKNSRVNSLGTEIEAKMEHWKKMVIEKWNIFHNTKSKEKSIDDCRIEKNSKIKTLKSILEDISASPSKTEGQEERQNEISNFMEKLEKIEKSSPEDVLDYSREIKEIEGIKDNIHDFFYKSF